MGNVITHNSRTDRRIGALNLVGIIDVGVDACGILSRSVGQTVEIWRTFGI